MKKEKKKRKKGRAGKTGKKGWKREYESGGTGKKRKDFFTVFHLSARSSFSGGLSKEQKTVNVVLQTRQQEMPPVQQAYLIIKIKKEKT